MVDFEYRLDIPTDGVPKSGAPKRALARISL